MFTESLLGISICRLCGAMVPSEIPIIGEDWDPQEIHEDWHKNRGEVWD